MAFKDVRHKVEALHSFEMTVQHNLPVPKERQERMKVKDTRKSLVQDMMMKDDNDVSRPG